MQQPYLLRNQARAAALPVEEAKARAAALHFEETKARTVALPVEETKECNKKSFTCNLQEVLS